MNEPAASDAATRRDVRSVGIAIWIGVAAGLGHGIPRYGLLHMGTVSLVGLMVILSVAIWAAIVALMPARPIKDSSK
jgi:hypothetical protein